MAPMVRGEVKLTTGAADAGVADVDVIGGVLVAIAAMGCV